MKTITRGLGPN